MDPEHRLHILQALADDIARRRLSAPARLVLDIVEPLGFLAGQIALFARPLTPFGRWHEYLTALEDEDGWRILHRMVDRQRN
jgi:hypothetical protein